MKITDIILLGGPLSSGRLLPNIILETVDGKNLHLE
jgi:hypothetical protein